MAGSDQLIQTTFLIPIRESEEIGNGELHPEIRWEALKEDLYINFKGWTLAPNLYPGGWVNPETGKRIEDDSRKYFVDIKRKDLNKMKVFVGKLAETFKQECIRFEHEGEVDHLPGRGGK